MFPCRSPHLGQAAAPAAPKLTGASPDPASDRLLLWGLQTDCQPGKQFLHDDCTVEKSGPQEKKKVIFNDQSAMCVISPGSSRIPSLPLAIIAALRAERRRHLGRDHEWEAAMLDSPAPEHRRGRQHQSQALGEPGGRSTAQRHAGSFLEVHDF